MVKIYGVAIIPAKTDSTRLKKKNLRVIADQTLVEHSILYAKKSKYIKDIIVTSNDEIVQDIAKKYDCYFYWRDEEYMGEREVADVYVNVFQNDFKDNGEWRIPQMATHVVGIQPDHPDRTNSLDTLLEYFVENKYDDLVTVDKNGTRNGSIRILKAKDVMQGTISRRVGSYLDNCTNIHSEQDLKNAEQNILNQDIEKLKHFADDFHEGRLGDDEEMMNMYPWHGKSHEEER
tara:strand:- start:399 stop:1097 length:699 start_codon:yes stop_codon:yes gene_type:complete